MSRTENYMVLFFRSNVIQNDASEGGVFVWIDELSVTVRNPAVLSDDVSSSCVVSSLKLTDI